MQSSTIDSGIGAAPTLTEGVAAWSLLCAKLRERARLDAEIVALTGDVARSGTIEAIEGVTLDTSLNLVHRLPAGERGMLLTAADVLADMPATMALLHDATLSWGQVRGIVAEAKRLSRADRAILDAHIGASGELLTKIDPDDAIDAVRIVVGELRGIRAAEKTQERCERANFVWAQPGIHGSGKLYGELDNLSLAQVLGRMDAMAPPDDGRSVSQRRADGLIALARHTCPDPDGDGDGDAGPAPRGTRHPRLGPRNDGIIVIVDTRDLTATAAGTILFNAPGCLPTITATTVEALAADATVRAVVVDGARPLTVTKKLTAKSIPADVRAAVTARDRGDRFPGARGPIEHLHHTSLDTGHNVDHLVGLQTKSHRTAHRHGWRADINPNTAEVTWTRRDRTWTTLPRGTRLRRPPPPDSGDGPDPPYG